MGCSCQCLGCEQGQPDPISPNFKDLQSSKTKLKHSKQTEKNIKELIKLIKLQHYFFFQRMDVFNKFPWEG